MAALPTPPGSMAHRGPSLPLEGGSPSSSSRTGESPHRRHRNKEPSNPQQRGLGQPWGLGPLRRAEAGSMREKERSQAWDKRAGKRRQPDPSCRTLADRRGPEARPGDRALEGENRELPTTKPRRGERDNGAELGATGASAPSGLCQVPHLKSITWRGTTPACPPPAGLARLFPLLPLFSFKAPFPDLVPLLPAAGRAVGAGRLREISPGESSISSSLSPSGAGNTEGGSHSRVTGYTVSSRLPVSAFVRGSEPRKRVFCC